MYHQVYHHKVEEIAENNFVGSRCAND